MASPEASHGMAQHPQQRQQQQAHQQPPPGVAQQQHAHQQPSQGVGLQQQPAVGQQAVAQQPAVAYWIYWGTCFATVITWAFAVAAAADDAWMSVNGKSMWKLGNDCGFDDSDCGRYEIATVCQFIATVLVSCALVVVVVASFSSPPRTGVLGLVLGIMLVYFSLFQMIAFSLVAVDIVKVNEYYDRIGYDDPVYNYEAGPTLGVAITAWLLGLAGAITILALRSRATNDRAGPFRKCLPGGGVMSGGASAGKNVGIIIFARQAYWIYWSACFATVITWVFAVAAAADDAWVSFNGESKWGLGEDCLLHDSVCVRYDAASAFQFIATVLVSVALVLVVVASFSSPPKTGVLGLVLGIMLAVFSVFQMIAFSLMAAAVTELNDTYDRAGLDDSYYDHETGPTLGVAVTAWLLGLAGTITILVLRTRATSGDEGPFRKCMSGGGRTTGEASTAPHAGTV